MGPDAGVKVFGKRTPCRIRIYRPSKTVIDFVSYKSKQRVVMSYTCNM